MLRAQASALGVPYERWDRVPALAVPWGTLAVVRLAASIRDRKSVSEESALAQAAGKIGLSHETVRGRLKDWLKDAYGLRGSPSKSVVAKPPAKPVRHPRTLVQIGGKNG